MSLHTFFPKFAKTTPANPPVAPSPSATLTVPDVPKKIAPTEYMPQTNDIYGNPSMQSAQARSMGRPVTMPGSPMEHYNQTTQIKDWPMASSALSFLWGLAPKPTMPSADSYLSVDPSRTYVPAPYLAGATRAEQRAMAYQPQRPPLEDFLSQWVGPELSSGLASAGGQFGI